jgi:hypothetical protein
MSEERDVSLTVSALRILNLNLPNGSQSRFSDIPDAFRRLHPVAGESAVNDSNLAADQIQPAKRIDIEIRNNQRATRLQDAPHLRQCFSGSVK